ncbi:MAG: inorganic pyrophosphatase [Gammaproteobacteria bacterium]|nr:inorganic pyrophosphatase [Gammaproteobacteria bacterium]
MVSQVRAHPWHGLPPRPEDSECINAFIEIVPADEVKFELDKPSGLLRIDRPQQYSSRYPALYGLIPRTYCGVRVGARSGERIGVKDLKGDGDPMDVLVLTEAPVAHGGFLCRARPIGGVRMIDRDEADDKILAVLEGDLAYGHFRDLADVPPALLERLRHYFLTYKQIPGDGAPKIRIAETYDRAEALRMLQLSIEDYRERFAG